MIQRLSKLSLYLTLLLLVMGTQRASACHGVLLVGFSASTNGSSVTVNGSSDAATCGCGPYYMEVELACFSAANFTGNAPTCTAANWNVYPWYRSILNVPNYTAANLWPDNCAVEPYFPVTIPFTDLCPGTTYVLRARERVCGSGSGGPWSPTYTFTTPGVAPSFALSATAAPPSICVGQQSTLTATINGAGGCGSGNPIFTWTPISPAGPSFTGNPVNVSPTVTTTYSVTATGGYLTCYGATPATVTVTVANGPTVGTPSASPLQICSGSSTTLTLTGYSANATVTWQYSATGLPPWTNIGTGSPLVWQPTATGYYHAVVTNNCGTATSTVIGVTVLPSANVTITPSSTSVCPGQSVTLSAAGGSNPYTWNPGNLTGSSVIVSPAVTTTFTVQSTVGGCTATQSVTITVNPQPTVGIAFTDSSVCAGTPVTMTGTGANTYSWSGGAFFNTPGNPQTDSPSTTTTYTVVGTDGNGCKDTANLVLTIFALPTITVTPNSPSVCPNQSATLTANGASTYEWHGPPFNNTPGPSQTVTPAATETYTVVGTDVNGCIDSSAVTVTVNNVAAANAGPDQSICLGSSATLNASGGVTYVWGSSPTLSSTSISNPSANPTTTTQYTVTVTDANGCFGSDSMIVTVNALPTPNAGPDATICAGQSTTLTGSGGNSYSWTPAATLTTPLNPSTVATPATTTQYIVTVTDANQCSANDTVMVTVNPLPVANAGPSQTSCGACVNFNATGGGVYNWSPATYLNQTNINNPQSCATSTILYTLTVIDANGCTDTDQVYVYVNPPLTAAATNNVSICPTLSTPLNVVAGGGDGYYTYAWSPATGLTSTTTASTTASPTVTTTYTITVTDGCGSVAAIDSVTVTVFPQPQLNITPSITSGCAPLCVNFTGMSVPASASCLFDFGDSNTSTNCNPANCYANAGNYDIQLTVTDINGCTATLTVPNMIIVHPVPVAGLTSTPADSISILTPDVNITNTSVGSDTTYYTVNNDSTFINNNQNFSYSFTDPGTYVITQNVINQWGCSDADSIVIVVAPDFIIYVPNAFSPNGDGINDEFRAWGDGLDLENFKLWIFDRWGNMVFTTTDIEKGWNGHANGGPDVAQIDTYIWRIQAKDNSANSHTFTGIVNLVK